EEGKALSCRAATIELASKQSRSRSRMNGTSRANPAALGAGLFLLAVQTHGKIQREQIVPELRYARRKNDFPVGCHAAVYPGQLGPEPRLLPQVGDDASLKFRQAVLRTRPSRHVIHPPDRDRSWLVSSPPNFYFFSAATMPPQPSHSSV